ncbi:MAG: MFS transporter [bacterium]
MSKFSKKLAYSFGAIAMALSSQAFATYIIFFYVDVIKMPAYLAAVGMLIFGVWNALNDPLAGYISDHTHSRWGRRIPYILFGAIPFGLIYWLIWNPPFVGVGQTALLFLYFVIMICLFDGFYTVTILNWSCLYPEMFSSLRERSEVNALRQTFTLIGLALGIALPPLIYGTYGWGWLGLAFGIIISVSLLITLRGSREHQEYSHEKQLGLWQSIKATFENRSFLTFAIANLFVQYSFVTILACIPFFTKYILDLTTSQTAALLSVAFLTAIPMLYVWEKYAIKVGAKKCFITTILLMAVALLPLFFVETFIGTLISATLIGMVVAGFILIADVIIADVIDEDEIKTGTRREGMYFGVHTFVTRFAIGLEALSIGLVFSLTGYNPYVFTQTREFVVGLRFLIAGLPLIALGIAFIIIWFYPLAGKRKMKAMKHELEEIHHLKGVE